MERPHLWLLAAVLAAGSAGAEDPVRGTPSTRIGLTPAVNADVPLPTIPVAKGVYQPTGLGDAKWGMTMAEVWKLYPKARWVPEDEQLGAPVVDGPYVDRLEVTDVTVPGLEKPTRVELRFWKGKFWATIIYLGDNDPEKVKAYIAKQFGPFTSGDDFSPMWVGEKVTTGAAYHQKWYGSSDNALSEHARKWFSDMLNGRWSRETAEEIAERDKWVAALTPKAGDEKKDGGATPTAAKPTPAPTK
jgi:hypothetical protein